MKKGLFFLLLTYLICMTAQAQVKQKELEKLFQDMLEYAKKGDADAQVLVGSYYYNGQGVGQDYAQAASWFRKAADQGIAEAQYNLGNCYKNGKGVKQDYAPRLLWRFSITMDKALQKTMRRQSLGSVKLQNKGRVMRKSFCQKQRKH